MIVQWRRKKAEQVAVATLPAFNQTATQPAVSVVEFVKPPSLLTDASSGSDSSPHGAADVQHLPPRLGLVPSKTLPAIQTNAASGKTKDSAIDNIADFRALVPFHSDMLGVVWQSKKGLCSNNQMTDLIGAFRQKDGSAIVVLSDRAQGGYLEQFVDSLKSEGVIVKETYFILSRVLTELYQEAADRKRSALASDSDELNESNATRMFADFIKKAVAVNASDFDIVCKGDSADFLFRVDGFRKPIQTFPQRMAETLIQNVYAGRSVKSGTRSHENYLPKVRQSMLLSITLDDGSSQYLRMQTLPGLGGPTCNWRLLPRKGKKQQFTSLEQLGYASDQERKLMSALMGGNGMVLFLGQTGMGKSTTMDLCFTLHPRRDGIKIIEVADPPEIENPYVIKHAVRGDADSLGEADAKMWTGALGAALRSDPDILAIGELRYAETALMAQQAMLSGHLTVASYHSSSPFMAIERLLEMGLSPSILFGEEGFQAFVSQELHPLMCKECSLTPKPEDWIFAAVEELRSKYSLSALDVKDLRVLGAGCEHCAGGPEPGYRKGRTACVSILQTSVALRDLLLSNPPATRVKLARDYFYSTRVSAFTEPDMTGKTVVQHMLYKVLKGDIPFDYFLEKTGAIADHHVSELGASS